LDAINTQFASMALYWMNTTMNNTRIKHSIEHAYISILSTTNPCCTIHVLVLSDHLGIDAINWNETRLLHGCF